MLDLSEAVDRLSAFRPEHIAIAEIVRSIRENSAEGKSYKGEELPGYVPAYKRRRAKLGLKTETVTLRVKAEDSLLDTLGEQEPNVITVIESKQPQAQGLAWKRDYMGVSDIAVTRMEEAWEEEFERLFS